MKIKTLPEIRNPVFPTLDSFYTFILHCPMRLVKAKVKKL